AAGAGVAVPVPRAANTVARLVGPDREPEDVARPIEHVEARESGPHDDGVEVWCRLGRTSRAHRRRENYAVSGERPPSSRARPLNCTDRLVYFSGAEREARRGHR